MGLYDEIYFEKGPIKEYKDYKHFQTKSLDKMMELYRITATGYLLKEIVEYRKPKPEEQIDFGGIKFPICIKEHKGWENYIYNGKILCYTYDMNFWYDLTLFIEAGMVEGIDIETRKRNQ